jgi:hypothetical protein
MRGAVQAGAVPAGTRVAVLVNGATRSSAEILAGECVRDASLRCMLTVYAVCILYTDGWRCWSTARRGRRRRYWQASVCVMPACAVYWNEASLCTGIACAVRKTLSVWRSSAEILAGECVCDASLRCMLIVYAACTVYGHSLRGICMLAGE